MWLYFSNKCLNIFCFLKDEVSVGNFSQLSNFERNLFVPVNLEIKVKKELFTQPFRHRQDETQHQFLSGEQLV